MSEAELLAPVAKKARLDATNGVILGKFKTMKFKWLELSSDRSSAAY